MYTFEGNITLEDYQNANRLNRKAKGLKLVFQILAYGIVVMLIVFSLSLIVRSPGLGTILPFLIMTGLIIYVFTGIPAQVKKLYAQQKELHLPYTMSIDEAGVFFKNEIGESKRPWNIFMKWREDKNLIVLYHSDLTFSMLAKRYLNEETIRFIHEQLKKNNIPEK